MLGISSWTIARGLSSLGNDMATAMGTAWGGQTAVCAGQLLPQLGMPSLMASQVVKPKGCLQPQLRQNCPSHSSRTLCMLLAFQARKPMDGPAAMAWVNLSMPRWQDLLCGSRAPVLLWLPRSGGQGMCYDFMCAVTMSWGMPRVHKSPGMHLP